MIEQPPIPSFIRSKHKSIKSLEVPIFLLEQNNIYRAIDAILRKNKIQTKLMM